MSVTRTEFIQRTLSNPRLESVIGNQIYTMDGLDRVPSWMVHEEQQPQDGARKINLATLCKIGWKKKSLAVGRLIL